jgi:predicted RNA binding protein YcfA (HicA-like mRNA interferase family)
MLKDQQRLTIPNPHEGDISREFLIRILRQAKINFDDWENL